MSYVKKFAYKETSINGDQSRYSEDPLYYFYKVIAFDISDLKLKKLNSFRFHSGNITRPSFSSHFTAYASVYENDYDYVEELKQGDSLGSFLFKGDSKYLNSPATYDFVSPINSFNHNYLYVLLYTDYYTRLNRGESFIELDYEEIIPTVIELYPQNIITSKTQNLIMSWNVEEYHPVGQKRYEIDWSSNGGTTWHSVSSVNANNYHEFAANTFPVGHIKYRVRVTNNDDQVSEWAYAEFEVVGTPDVPIPDVSSSREGQFPRIIWDGPFQRAYEAQILTPDKKTLLKGSGVVMDNTDEYEGEGYNRFTDYIVPANTVLVARVKFLNKYGNWSDWGETSFRIRGYIVPEYPPTDIIAQVNGLSVDTRCTPNESEPTRYTYITRNGEMVGKCDGSFIKDYPKLNTDITYSAITIDRYNLISKCDDVVVRIDYDGIVVHDPKDMSKYIAISEAEETLDVIESDTVNYSLNRLLGKDYPVRDQNNWKNTTRTVNCHLTDDEFNKLKQWSQVQSGVFFRGTNAAWYASMDITDNGKYIGGGRNVTLTFTRIYKDERRDWIED